MILSASRFLLWATGTRQVTFGGKAFGVSDETAFIFLFKLDKSSVALHSDICQTNVV